VHAIAQQHDISGSSVLGLEHRALVGCVWPRERLRDHPVEASTLELDEPAPRERDIPRRLGFVYRWLGALEEVFEQLPAIGERKLEQ
jgi:hypothetical protein